MKYFMFIAEDPTADPYVPEDDDIVGWVHEMVERDIDREGDRLQPADRARTVRIRNDELIVTQGPFTESREVIAGYGVIECADLDEAIEVTSRHPMARFGRIELRPFWPFEG